MAFRISITLPRRRTRALHIPYIRPTISILKSGHSRRREPSRGKGKAAAPAAPVMNNMDPDCAICSHPAIAQCECEANALDKAVGQAEQRMMASVFTEIRYIPFHTHKHN